jgi:hypothetical protein
MLIGVEGIGMKLGSQCSSAIMSLFISYILFASSKRDLYRVGSYLLALHSSLNSFIIPFSKELKKALANRENEIKTEPPQTRHNKHKNSSRIQLKFFKIFTLDVISFPFKGSLGRRTKSRKDFMSSPSFGHDPVIDAICSFRFKQNLISVWDLSLLETVVANLRDLPECKCQLCS